MAPRTAAMIWLGAGIVFALITLGVLGGGGYWFYHANDKHASAFRIWDEERKELEGNKAIGGARLKELTERRTKNADDVNDWSEKRRYAGVFALSAIIPFLVTASCLFRGIMGLMRKPKDGDEDEDRPRKKKKAGDDDEEEEKPVKKKKKKDDDETGIKKRGR